MTLVALAVPGLPWLLAIGVLLPALRRRALALLPLGPLPALALLAAPDFRVEVPGLLLGTALGLDPIGRAVLLLGGLVWLAAAVHAGGYLVGDGRRARFAALFLVAMGGSLGLPLALDAASFYLLYAAIGFSAWGLVVHAGTAEARLAGRVYLAMAIASEAAILAAFLVGATRADALALDAIARVAVAEGGGPVLVLGLLGFGVKAAALGLHVWLPPAHAIAPAPASAVLSGVIVKAGILGAFRLLGPATLPDLGALLVALGIAGAAWGILAGLGGRTPKVVLAYSTVSQLGFVIAAVGAGLAGGGSGTALLYALHHGLAKGGLFLGAAVVPALHGRTVRRLGLAGLALLALSLAGAPLTGGAVAKAALKAAAPGAAIAFSLLAIGSTCLLARFLWLVRRPDPHAHGGGPRTAASFAALAAAAPVVPWLVAAPEVAAKALAGSAGAAWPPAIGLLAAAAAVRSGRRFPWTTPAGDLLVVVLAAAPAVGRAAGAIVGGLGRAQGRAAAAASALGRVVARALDPVRAEVPLGRWPVIGALFAALVLLLAAIA